MKTFSIVSREVLSSSFPPASQLFWFRVPGGKQMTSESRLGLSMVVASARQEDQDVPV